MNNSAPLVVFGGTFDPIHYGHLRLAENLHNLIADAEIRIIPSARPPLKVTPKTDAKQRMAMVKLALAECRHLVADDRELTRGGMSYTLISVQELFEENPGRPIILVLGTDAYRQFASWHRWQELTQLAVLLVVSRPTDDGDPESDFRQEQMQLNLKQCESLQDLLQARRQAVYYYTAPMLDISATQIRHLIANQQSPRFLLPQSVIEYIEQNNLYSNQSTQQSKVTE